MLPGKLKWSFNNFILTYFQDEDILSSFSRGECNVPILSLVYIQAYHVHINQVNKDGSFCIILVQVCTRVQIYAHIECLIN